MQTVKNREKYYKEAFKPLVEYFKDQFKGKIREVTHHPLISPSLFPSPFPSLLRGTEHLARIIVTSPPYLHGPSRAPPFPLYP
jgi:hypothetical protein